MRQIRQECYNDINLNLATWGKIRVVPRKLSYNLDQSHYFCTLQFGS